MIPLHIALEEGFVHDTVVVHVNDALVASESDVTTRTQIGLAKSYDVTVPPGRNSIQIELPLKHIARTIELELSQEHWVGISLEGDTLTHRDSSSLFGYV